MNIKMLDGIRKPRVVFEQYVIPHYRVPFFTELSKFVDLTVVSSKDKNIDGLHNITKDLPFNAEYLEQKRESGLFHPDLMGVLEKNDTDILISFATSLDLLLNNKKALDKLRSMNIKVMRMGCDGYMVKHFYAHLFLSLINPRSTLRTIKSMISKSRTDFFLPHANHNARYLHRSLLVPMKKIRVVYNTLDVSKLNSSYHKELTGGTKRHPHRIIFTGRLVKNKAAHVLIKAFARVLKTYADASLEIVGEGSETDSLKKLVKQLNIEKKVDFSGPVYEDEVMASHLARASLYVMPGLGGLGFNTAMAAALPVIYTDADGTEKDMIKDGHNGWYFNGSVRDLTAKLKIALSDPVRLSQMGEISEDLIMRKFNLKNMVRAYMDSIHHILDEKSR